MTQVGPYRVGCVGAGFVAEVYHLPVQQQLAEIQTAAICDVDVSRASAQAAKFEIPAVYSNVREMIENESLDVISVCVPPDLHLSVTKAAAEAGIHVICEKPLAPTPDEVAEMVRTVESSGIKFMVAENFWWYPDLVDAKKRVDEGKIGDVFHVRIEEFINDIDPTYRRRQGRFLIFEQDVHYIDVIRHLVGSEVIRVHALTRQISSQELAGENLATITMEFDNGVIARIDECWCSARGDQFVMRMRIDGTEGSIFLNQPEHPYKIYSDKVGYEGWHFPPTNTRPPIGHREGYAAPWPVVELREGTIGVYRSFIDYLIIERPPFEIPLLRRSDCRFVGIAPDEIDDRWQICIDLDPGPVTHKRVSDVPNLSSETIQVSEK